MTILPHEITPSSSDSEQFHSFAQKIFDNYFLEDQPVNAEASPKQESENEIWSDSTEEGASEDLCIGDLLALPAGSTNFTELFPPVFSTASIQDEVEPITPHTWGINWPVQDDEPAFPDIFSREEKKKHAINLSEATDGILTRKTTRNISEVAEYLMKSLELAEVGRVLALYVGPDWVLLPYQEAVHVFLEYIGDNQTDLFKYLKSNDFKDIYSKIMASPDIEHLDEIPLPDHNLLCCADGMYDWHEDTVRDGKSKYFRFSHLNISANDIFCQETRYFDRFMDNVTLHHDDLRQLLLEVIGVIVTGYPTKHFFVFEGVPNSGKSQMSNFLKYVLGPSSCSSVNDINQLSDRWTTGMLPGKLLCVCPDVPDRPLKAGAVGVIKKLTGDDPIQGERKYENPFVFQNTAKLLFLSNAPLRLAGGSRDAGFQKRILRVPFYNSVPEEAQIPQLYKKLSLEAGGIIWKALQALRELESRNGVFTQVDVEEYWRAEDDLEVIPPDLIVRDFIDSCCILDAGAYVECRSLYEAFDRFQKSAYADEPGINNSYFGRLLMDSGYPLRPHRTGTARGYYGITLRNRNEASWETEVGKFDCFSD